LPYFGGDNPGDDTHSLMWDAVSMARQAQQLFALFAVGQLLGLTPEGFRLLTPLLFEGQLPTHEPPFATAGARPVSLSPMDAGTVR
jgi:hypothetical protein